MGSSRRERSKKEGSFLEFVKTILQELQVDVKQIKSQMHYLPSEIQSIPQPIHQHVVPFWCDADPNWYEWDSSCAWWALKSDWFPIDQPHAVDRPTLLKYRSLADNGEPPEEFQDFQFVDVSDENFVKDTAVAKVCTTGNRTSAVSGQACQVASNSTSNYKLWGRRRPSAKARRNRRSLAWREARELSAMAAEDFQSSSHLINPPALLSNEANHDDDNGSIDMVPQDGWEMILPVFTASTHMQADGDYTFFNGSLSWPAKLKRSAYAFSLPLNIALLEQIDSNLHTGSAYRDDWQEDAVIIHAPARDQPWQPEEVCGICYDEQAAGEEEHLEACSSTATTQDDKWGQSEIQIWMTVTARLANRAAVEAIDSGHVPSGCMGKRMAVIQERWDKAWPKIPDSLRDDLWGILCEQPKLKCES